MGIQGKCGQIRFNIDKQAHNINKYLKEKYATLGDNYKYDNYMGKSDEVRLNMQNKGKYSIIITMVQYE